MEGFTTRVIHTKYLKKDVHGALHYPVYDCVAYEFDSAEDIAAAFQGRKPAHAYSRITNPTVQHFEEKIRAATGAQGVVALSSGMAAISNLIITICESGDNIITTRHLFGNSYSLFEKTLKPWGLQVKYTDLNKSEDVGALIDDKTKAIFFETITNPQLEVVDIEKLAAIAKKHDLLLIADSTISPLYFADLKALGVHVEVISSTKYISGGATSVGGLIIDNGTYAWKKNPKMADAAKKFGPFALVNKLKRESYRNLGACLSPHSAYLQSIGLDTMALRAGRSCDNALQIARYLERHEKIASVNYPGIESSKYHEVAKKQFKGKYGGLLTFDLESQEACFTFINALNIIRRATNLNDNKSLIIHPSSTIYCEYDDALKLKMGVRDTMIRLAVGIEDVEDLINDINSALEAI